MASPRRSRHSRSGSESEDGAIRDGGDRHRHRRRRTDSRDRRDDSPRGRGSYRDHPSDRRDEPRRRQRSRTPPPRSVPDLAPATAFPSGGAYIPPARLRQMQAQITDRSSPEYQRMSWEALKKSINGYVNKVNTSNIKEIIPELLSENLIRGRGLFTRSIMKAQAASSSYTPVYAALVAVVNTKLPAVGELLLHRLVLQFRRAFRQNNKPACLATTTFIAHLTNQKLVNEILAFQILQLLFDNATDDSVEVAIGFMKACGAYLTEIAPRVTDSMFDILRSTLHEADIDQRVQYMIEVLFQIRKTQFKDYPAIPEGLDIVEEDDQIVHEILLEDESIKPQDELNLFSVDSDYEANEAKYQTFRSEILGDDSDDDDDASGGSSADEGGSASESDSDADSDASQAERGTSSAVKAVEKVTIQDRTSTNLIALRRTIYLTIMSSANFEEGIHKLLNLRIPADEEIELCNMLIECCAQERTYLKFYGLIGERLCKLPRAPWRRLFERCLVETYETIHRYETNRLRNVAKFFAHLLATDGLPWAALSIFTITEAATTSSSRIFIKVLFSELTEALGLVRLNDRLKDPEYTEAFRGLFPIDHPKDTRFAINYFTSIGLGGLTADMREHLKHAPVPNALAALPSSSESDTDSSSDSDTTDSSDSDSESASSSGTESDRRSYRGRHRRHRRDSPSPRRRRRSPASDTSDSE